MSLPNDNLLKCNDCENKALWCTIVDDNVFCDECAGQVPGEYLRQLDA